VTYACDVPAVPRDAASIEARSIERHLGPMDDADTAASTDSESLQSASVGSGSAGR
jgi:hypothetical protein